MDLYQTEKSILYRILTTINWTYPTSVSQNTKIPHPKNIIIDIIYFFFKKQTALDKIVGINGKKWFVVTTESGLVNYTKFKRLMNRK